MLEALGGTQFEHGDKKLFMRMYFMNHDRPFDLDGAFSAMKWHIDGIAEALNINDSSFSEVTLIKGENDITIPHPFVEVHVGVVE